MKILVADHVAEKGTAALTNAGHKLVERPGLLGKALLEALEVETPDVLVVRSTRVTAEALDASSNLALIVRAGAGYDTIDVDGAANRGIFVANCPGKKFSCGGGAYDGPRFIPRPPPSGQRCGCTGRSLE